MNRKDRRKYAKQVAKGEININNHQSGMLVPTAIKDYEGNRYTSIESYLDAMEKFTAKGCGDIAAELLYNTEKYMAVANIIIMLYATKMAIGDLKTVQKSYQKILNNFNSATDYVERVGIRKAYEDFRNDYGIELVFDEVDIDWMVDEGAEIAKRFKLKFSRDKTE